MLMCFLDKEYQQAVEKTKVLHLRWASDMATACDVGTQQISTYSLFVLNKSGIQEFQEMESARLIETRDALIQYCVLYRAFHNSQQQVCRIPPSHPGKATNVSLVLIGAAVSHRNIGPTE